jgi:hypothetical protein
VQETPIENAPLGHGASDLPRVTVEAYNSELRDPDGFLGDRASTQAFRTILDEWRDKLRKVSDDPLGEKATDEIGKKKLDKILAGDELEAAGLVQSAIEDFASELATVTSRFLKTKAWKNVERIVVGGGMRASRVGELAIGRASVLIKAAGHDIDLVPIRHDPDDAGLIGAVHLAPAWGFSGFDALIAIDIGGSNIRCGLVEFKRDLGECVVREREMWRHSDDKPKRDEVVDHIVEMIDILVKRSDKDGLKLAPLVGIGVPGVIRADGSIDRGGQNLPGNWESKSFRLPERLKQRVPKIGEHDTHLIMHNDAVVQGLSQLPFMGDVERWGVLTVGTGLGNAAFANKKKAKKQKQD